MSRQLKKIQIGNRPVHHYLPLFMAGLLSACGGSSSNNNDTDSDTNPPSTPSITSLTTEDSTPTLSGTFDASDAAGGFSVTLNGTTYTLGSSAALSNSGNSWNLTVPSGSELAPGTYDVQASASDESGNTATDSSSNELVINEPVVADTSAPTTPSVTSLSTEDNTPTLSGTFDASDAAGGFSVTLNGTTYTLGSSSELSNSGNNWSLTIPSGSELEVGTYDVQASASDESGNTATDSSSNELVITAPTVVDTSSSRYLTQGIAQTTVSNLYPQGSRVAAVGTITGDDNTSWTVPAENRYQDSAMPFASDLYNNYVSGHNYSTASAALSALDGSDIVNVDADGEVITAYIFGDNYFEMYVNGTPVGKDLVPYTEFNSNIVRFRVKPPFDVAMLLVDWEEHLGTGTENNNGNTYHPGDGGMVAVFKDANDSIIGVTDGNWKAQTYYTAPITDLTCLSESGSSRLSSSCSTDAPSDITKAYGVHWQRPSNWTSADYDDSNWPSASVFTNATVGVDNKPAYTHFTNLFDDASSDAQFIWSTNLVLDNEVLVRGTVGNSSFSLSSKALKPDMILPLSASCEGSNKGSSLPLSWSGAPASTQSFALTMHHFPNPADAGDYSKAHSYWSVYDIPASTSGLTEGETDIGTFGINSVDGQQTYTAPCSADTTEHEYTITLFALSAPVGSLGLTGSVTDLATLRTAIAPYTLDSTDLTLSQSHYNTNSDDHVPSRVASTCADKSVAFEPYSDYTSVSCSGNTFTVTSQTFLPYRSSLDADKPTVGIQSWIGRVPVPQQALWTLPIEPTYLSGTQSNLNIHYPIGISVEGIPILHYAKENSLNEIAQLGTDYSDRDTALLGEIDQCGGHAGNGEDYHYHTAPICLMDTHDPSQPLAYMFDGLPLYFGTGGGQLVSDGVDFGSGRYSDLNYLPQKVKTGERSLDECNAYDLHGDGSEYVYYSTSTAPYSIGCYRAEADQASSMPIAPHWQQERDLAWSGDVNLTDFDTMTFAGQTWSFNELTPRSGNDRITSGNTALILYRQLSEGEDGYQSGLDCYAFRYRLDSSDTDGLNDTTATHCR